MGPRDILARHAYGAAWTSDVPQTPFEDIHERVIEALLEDADSQIKALDVGGYMIVSKSMWFKPDDDGKPNDVQ